MRIEAVVGVELGGQAPLVEQLQLLDHLVEVLLTFDDGELRLHERLVGQHLRRVHIEEYIVLRLTVDLECRPTEVFLRHHVGDHRGGHEDQKEGEEDDAVAVAVARGQCQ